ncbi:MAG: RidA family protein [Planctomycetaceae bacterium]
MPEAPRPIAAYVPAVRTGNLCSSAGSCPSQARTSWRSPVPSTVPVDQAQSAAGQCVLNGLAALKGELNGDLSRLRRVVRIAFLRDNGFDQQSLVANGASELLEQVLEKLGRHARSGVMLMLLMGRERRSRVRV